jgi:enoyl-CoA hydratase
METALAAEQATMTSPDHVRIIDDMTTRAQRRATAAREA